jgi:hypothetical protein
MSTPLPGPVANKIIMMARSGEAKIKRGRHKQTEGEAAKATEPGRPSGEMTSPGMSFERTKTVGSADQ